MSPHSIRFPLQTSGLKGKGEKPRLSKKQNVGKPSHNSLVDIFKKMRGDFVLSLNVPYCKKQINKAITFSSSTVIVGLHSLCRDLLKKSSFEGTTRKEDMLKTHLMCAKILPNVRTGVAKWEMFSEVKTEIAIPGKCVVRDKAEITSYAFVFFENGCQSFSYQKMKAGHLAQ